MNVMVRTFAALMWLISLLFVSTPAAAQEPELKPYPDVQVGLWKTVAVADDGSLTFVFAGSAEEACQIQHRTFNPLATYVGAIGDSELVRGCSWIRFVDGGPVGSNTTIGTNVYFVCPDWYYVSGGLCYVGHVKIRNVCNNACGDKAQAASPDLNIGNPINISTGLKVAAETDYETADGLLSVDRQYASGTGVGWHTLLPGWLEMFGPSSGEVNFHSRGGGVDEFVSANHNDQTDWPFA